MQISSVQVLRAMAALTVIVGHVQGQSFLDTVKFGGSFTPTHILPWGAGVDLFFVISGFIMVVSSEKLFAAPQGSATFLARRFARIIPLYWMFATLYLFSIFFAASKGQFFPTWPDIIASYAFWPSDVYGNGYPQPFYALGWTLDYEIFFYVLFALFLALPREKAVACVAAALAVGVGLGLCFKPSFVPLAFWSQPIVLEFALGMGIALLFQRGIILGSAVRWLLFVGGCLALSFDGMDVAHQPPEWITPNNLQRVLCWGLPAGVLLAALVLKPERAQASNHFTRAIAALGDASYALYLVHPFVIIVLNKIWIWSGLYLSLGFWPYIAAVLICASALALAVNRWFEVPLTRRLRVKKRMTPPDVARPSLSSHGA